MEVQLTKYRVIKCTLISCTTSQYAECLPLGALLLFSEVNDVEIEVITWSVVCSLAWENSAPPPVTLVVASSPAAGLWRITPT